MEKRTTNSVDARRAAAYLSKYCTECVGCIECIFDIGNEGQDCRINSGRAPCQVGTSIYLVCAGHHTCKGYDAICKNHRLAHRGKAQSESPLF